MTISAEDGEGEQQHRIGDLLKFLRTLPVREAGEWKHEDLYDRSMGAAEAGSEPQKKKA